MRRKYQVLMCLTMLGLLPIAKAEAGWMIEEEIHYRAGSSTGPLQALRNSLIISANRMKTTRLSWDENPLEALTIDLELQTLMTADYKRRMVVIGPVREYGVALWGLIQILGGPLAGPMRQRWESLQGMPFEQRQVGEHQMLEEMMQSSVRSGPPAGILPSAEACREPKITTQSTADTARIAGYQATRYHIYEDGKFTQEIWVSRGITAWQEVDLKKLERFIQDMSSKALEVLPGCGRGHGLGLPWLGPHPNDPAWRLVHEGYAVRIVNHGEGGGTGLNVVKAKSGAVPLTQFQPPTGFARQTFLGQLIHALKM